MTKHLAESFVELRSLRLFTQPSSNFALIMLKGCLNVAAFVIARKKNLAVELVVVEELRHRIFFFFAFCVECVVWSKSGSHIRISCGLERDVRHGLMVCDKLVDLQPTNTPYQY